MEESDEELDDGEMLLAMGQQAGLQPDAYDYSSHGGYGELTLESFTLL